MEIVDRVRELGASAVDHGRKRINGRRVDRRRDELLHELGEARYAESKGVATSAGEIERIIGEIDDLDRDDESATATDQRTATDEDSDTSKPGTE